MSFFPPLSSMSYLVESSAVSSLTSSIMSSFISASAVQLYAVELAFPTGQGIITELGVCFGICRRVTHCARYDWDMFNGRSSNIGDIPRRVTIILSLYNRCRRWFLFATFPPPFKWTITVSGSCEMPCQYRANVRRTRKRTDLSFCPLLQKNNQWSFVPPLSLEQSMELLDGSPPPTAVSIHVTLWSPCRSGSPRLEISAITGKLCEEA